MYKISNSKGVSFKVASYARAMEVLEAGVRVLSKFGEVARINMDIAPPAAPLGDVRPSSSGPISFGYRVEIKGEVSYVMAEPI